MADQTRIPEEEKEQRVSQLDGWKLVDEKFVTKRFRFQDFLTGFSL